MVSLHAFAVSFDHLLVRLEAGAIHGATTPFTVKWLEFPSLEAHFRCRRKKHPNPCAGHEDECPRGGAWVGPA